jgi:serine/threonine protein kinase
MPGFGYVMPLLEPRFVSLAQLLNTERQPSFRVITTIGRELVDAFAALHSAGLCYRDISFGNLRVDPAAREAAIIDVDNVGVDGGSALVKGTGPFMAPELLRDEALPSTVTDLHSLAVLLFYLLMHGHPLFGVRTDASWLRPRVLKTRLS